MSNIRYSNIRSGEIGSGLIERIPAQYRDQGLRHHKGAASRAPGRLPRGPKLAASPGRAGGPTLGAEIANSSHGLITTSRPAACIGMRRAERASRRLAPPSRAALFGQHWRRWDKRA